MTPQELINSILQLAIQGKLVEQRLEEGTAEELYQQIQAEKQKLIKAGTIKKGKPLLGVTDDEKPFDIPKGWKWVRLQSIITLNPKNDIDDNLDVAFIPMSYIGDGFSNQHFSEVKKWGVVRKGFTHFANGDIGIAKITPCFQNRKSVIFRELKNGYGAGTTELSIIRVIGNTIDQNYLLWFFKTEYFIAHGVKSFSGTAGQQRIHKDYLATSLIPLPPLAEQKRIVAKIEEMLPYIDRYEQAWNELEELDKKFPEDLQKSILQIAIQGKMVEQRSEEGTAEELFRQIQAEKEKLVESGTIKNEKPLPEITGDEKPFDIPESWKWVRLGSIGITQTGNTPSTAHPGYWGNDVPFITPGDILNGNIAYNSRALSILGKSVARVCSAGAALQVCIGGSIGKAAITDREITFNQQINSVTPILCDSKYVLAVVTAQYFVGSMKECSGGTATPIINRGMWNSLLIPLPPLAEQKRIVTMLEKSFSVVQRLKGRAL